MSHYINQNWYDRARACLEFYEGKLPAELIQADLDTDDMEELQFHVMQAEAEMSQFHFAQEPNEFLGAGDEY